MYNLTDYNNQIQNNQTVRNQPYRSNDQIFMLNTITTTVPTRSWPYLAPLKKVAFYSLSSTNNNPFQTKTKLIATANQCQTFYQAHTSPNICPSALLPSSFSTVNPLIFSSVITRNYTLSFVVMNKSVESLERFDLQKTPEKYLHQIGAHMIFTMGEQPFLPVSDNQRKMAYIQCSLTENASSWFLRLQEKYKNYWSAFVSAFKKLFFFTENCILRTGWKSSFLKNKPKTYVFVLWNFNHLFKHVGVMNLLQLSTSNVKKFLLEDYQKELKNFAQERIVKHSSSFPELSFPFHTLVKLVDAEGFTNENIRTLDLPLEVNNVTSKLESQELSAEKFVSNLEMMLTQTTDPTNESKPQFRKYCKYCRLYHQSVSNFFREQHEDEERRRDFYSRSKSLVKSFNQYLEAYKNQNHSNEQPSSYPVNYYSRNSFGSGNRSNSRNWFSPYRYPRSRSPSVSRHSREISRYLNCFCEKDFKSSRFSSRSRYTEFNN